MAHFFVIFGILGAKYVNIKVFLFPPKQYICTSHNKYKFLPDDEDAIYFQECKH